MEKLEKHLEEVWKEIRSQAVVNLGDIDKLNNVFALTFIKLQRQRVRLESSRDMWKNKYFKEKKKNE